MSHVSCHLVIHFQTHFCLMSPMLGSSTSPSCLMSPVLGSSSFKLIFMSHVTRARLIHFQTHFCPHPLLHHVTRARLTRQWARNFQKQSYINIKLGSFTSPSYHVGRGNESEWDGNFPRLCHVTRARLTKLKSKNKVERSHLL